MVIIFAFETTIMSSKDFILGILVVVVLVLGYLFLTQTQMQAPTAPSAPTNVTPPSTQPPTTQPPTTNVTPEQPVQNVTPELPEANVTPPTNDTNDTGIGIILTPINITEDGNTTLVRVPPSTRTNTSTLVAIYPTFIVADPYDFLNDPFDFSNLIPVRGETACKNQCDAFCLAEKGFCKDKCDDVHDEVCDNAVAQSLICKAACIEADLTLWDTIECGNECEKQIAKACSVFSLAECNAKCAGTYYHRCKEECYETC
jgi:hypothetical protein